MAILRTLHLLFAIIGYLFTWRGPARRGRKALAAGNEAELQAIVDRVVQQFGGAMLGVSRVTVEVKGRENLPEGTCVYVANHRSLFDIPILLDLLGPVSFLAKAELKKVPMIRDWMELLRCVFVDRKDTKASLAALREAEANVAAGHSMVIFPEGTRSKGPEGELGAFKGGAFRAALKSKAPVVPILIHNSRDIFEKNHHLVKPRHIVVEVLPAVATAGLGREAQKALPAAVEESMRKTLASGVYAPVLLPEKAGARGHVPTSEENPYRPILRPARSFEELRPERENGEGQA